MDLQTERIGLVLQDNSSRLHDNLLDQHLRLNITEAIRGAWITLYSLSSSSSFSTIHRPPLPMSLDSPLAPLSRGFLLDCSGDEAKFGDPFDCAGLLNCAILLGEGEGPGSDIMDNSSGSTVDADGRTRQGQMGVQISREGTLRTVSKWFTTAVDNEALKSRLVSSHLQQAQAR